MISVGLSGRPGLWENQLVHTFLWSWSWLTLWRETGLPNVTAAVSMLIAVHITVAVALFWKSPAVAHITASCITCINTGPCTQGKGSHQSRVLHHKGIHASTDLNSRCDFEAHKVRYDLASCYISRLYKVWEWDCHMLQVVNQRHVQRWNQMLNVCQTTLKHEVVPTDPLATSRHTYLQAVEEEDPVHLKATKGEQVN